MWTPFKKKTTAKKKTSAKNKISSQAWIITTVVLGVFFVGVLIYTYVPSIKSGTTANNGKTQQLQFNVPITIIYDTKVPEQKGKIEVFVNSLANSEKGLKSTSLQEKWLDVDSAEAKALLQESQAKYLPVALLDQSIETHPQFKAISQYLQKAGQHYYFHLYPLEHLQTPPLTGGNSKGVPADKAKVTILEYGSFTCSHCKDMEDVLAKIMKDYPNKIALVYKPYDRGGYDNTLSQAALCAADQNKFWEMHDKLFADQDNMIKMLTTASDSTKTPDQAKRDAIVFDYLTAKAKALGLKTKDFSDCLTTKKYQKSVENTTLEAGEYGIGGTPAFFLNKRFADGAYTYEDFKVLVDGQMQ